MLEGVTKMWGEKIGMDTTPPWLELICCAENFHGDNGHYVEQSLDFRNRLHKTEKVLHDIEERVFKHKSPAPHEKEESLNYVKDELRKTENEILSILPPISPEEEHYLLEWHGLVGWIVADIENGPGLDEKQILNMVISRTYDLVFSEFSNSKPNHNDAVYDACFFTSLCMFLHHSKRVGGKSIRNFIYDNSPNDYSILGSEGYFDINERGIPGKEMDEEVKLRKDKERILTNKLLVGDGEYIANRDVYIKRPQGEAISADAEHEWTMFWLLDVLDDDLRDTYKRISNLYKDVLKNPGSPNDTGYKNRLIDSHRRFMSKLKKIKYDSFLKLQKVILLHICEDQRYRGMNIYRFEKRLRLYNLTCEVNRLLECKDEAEEKSVLQKSILLNEIYFPKVYQDFCTVDDPSQLALCARTFMSFIKHFVGSCRLSLDYLVGKGYLGDDWETLFLNTINEMTDKVFYNPNEIDFTAKPGSQGMFEKVISAPVKLQFDRYLSISIPMDDNI